MNEYEDKNKIDFLAIGDIVIDAFIKLTETSANIVGTPDTPDYKICIPFGEKVPYDDVFVIPAVGNAANAAVSAARLGLNTAFVTNLGDDRNGEDCLDTLRKNNVKTDFVKVNPGFKTNYHYILWYGAERTILIKHQNYPYIMPNIGSPKWVYFSSVNETAFPFHNKLADYLDTNKDINLAFQPGKFEIKLGKEKLGRLYKQSKMFFCNVEEAEKILEIQDLKVKDLLQKMHDFGPQTVVITDGPRGAYAYDGTDMYFIKSYPDPKPPFSRTGAGDAFSSTVLSAMILGKTLPEALAWGGINAMAVVQQVGAHTGLLSHEQLEEYLKKAPADYKAVKI
ncbi:MAG: carbohydrate kinase family protein [Candidatus Pacebacteria bacterium]|nr:carbohydrate kinase family protein [Candidatus Paceibacterota bacterium]